MVCALVYDGEWHSKKISFFLYCIPSHCIFSSFFSLPETMTYAGNCTNLKNGAGGRQKCNIALNEITKKKMFPSAFFHFGINEKNPVISPFFFSLLGPTVFTKTWDCSGINSYLLSTYNKCVFFSFASCRLPPLHVLMCEWMCASVWVLILLIKK